MNKKIGFVILHYMSIDDTINCVNSILKNVYSSYIVIVDNASVNNSGKKLYEKYRENSKIKVILLEENIGFAKGNNIGINFLSHMEDIDFIVVLNNDTLLLENNFEKLIYEEYEKSNFSVLGPMVIDQNNDITSNPVTYVVDSLKKANVLLIKRYIKLILNYLKLNFLVKDVGNNKKNNTLYDNNKRYENVKLHGCCWILSPIFKENKKELNDATFLYFEEDILFLELMQDNKKTVYNPKIKIRHLEDSATNMITKSNRGKNIFVLKNEIKSIRVLKKVIKNIKKR